MRLARGAVECVAPTSATDRWGTLRRSSVRAYGDTVHSFVSRAAYAGSLAPGFETCPLVAPAGTPVGITRFELRDDGSLYAAVTLPSIIVGTIGGGTGLPGQRACLEILNLTRPEDANALAEVCAALALAGELSIIGALSAQEFSRAHRRLARGKK